MSAVSRTTPPEEGCETKLMNSSQFKAVDIIKIGPPLLKSCRFVLLVMMFFGFLLLHYVRLNLSMAIVCMVISPDERSDMNSSDSHTRMETNHSHISKCLDLTELKRSNVTGNQGEFDWDRKMMTSVLASYFYGYVPVQVIGGWAASKFGGKHVYGTGMLVASVMSLLSPIAARTSPYFLLTLRILIGAGHGVCFPAGHALFGRWLPKFERSQMISLAISGANVGSVLAFLLTGLFCTVQFDDGWPLSFYIPGILGIVWWIAYICLVYNSPSEHPRISTAEKMYIMNSIGEKCHSGSENIAIPWKEIAKSPAVWAIIAAHVATSFGLLTTSVALPLYMKDVLKYNNKQNGGLSALPQICLTLLTPLIGFLADTLRKRKLLTTVAVRKLCQAIGLVGCAGFFIGAGFLDCNQRSLAIAFITIAVALLAFVHSGFMVNHVDIAPRIAGLIYSISNTFANCAGFIIPHIVGAIVVHGTREEWQTVLYIFSTVMLIGAVVFSMFAQGEIQDWAIDIGVIEIDIRKKAASEELKQIKNEDH